MVAGYAIVTGVPWQAFAAAAYLGVAGYWAFRTGEFGGGDVKAITVLPLAFPLWWPAVITVSLVVAAVGLRAREEIPFVVAIFVGVVTSLAVS